MKNALWMTLTLLGWNAFFRLIVLTVVTYFMSNGGASFSDIVEVSASNRIAFAGLSVITLTLVLTQPNPLFSFTRNEIINWKRIEGFFMPAFIRGSVFGCVFVLCGLILGHYQFLGFFVLNEVSFFTLAVLIFKVFCIFAMVWLHEFYYRQKMFEYLRNHFDPLRQILIAAMIYTLMQSLQFQIGLAHQLTLTLIGVSLGLRTFLKQDFGWGAGLLFGFLIVVHIVFSLPLLGNESQGIILVKYNYKAEIDAAWMRFLTGGAGGPLASITIQSILIIDCFNLFKQYWLSRAKPN